MPPLLKPTMSKELLQPVSAHLLTPLCNAMPNTRACGPTMLMVTAAHLRKQVVKKVEMELKPAHPLLLPLLLLLALSCSSEPILQDPFPPEHVLRSIRTDPAPLPSPPRLLLL